MRITSLSGMFIFLLALSLTGCSMPDPEMATSNPVGMGGGMGSGMMDRHHAQIPSEYAGLSNPITAYEESFERGAASYIVHCATCHGDGGMGDGPAGTALDPAPAAIAHTSQMMSDDYLFWRISEGSGSFNTAMPGWKNTLDEQARWDVINYVRALGTGEIEPQSGMGGSKFDPAAEAARQAEVLAQAVEQGVVTQAEADIFKNVHGAVEQYRVQHPEIQSKYSSATERQAAILEELVNSQFISRSDADAFMEIHDRLGASGLMP
jgi:mono/diheme cytochrome c family protein